MQSTNKTLSKTRLKRLRAQGYNKQCDLKLSNMAFGIRFAYRLCTTIIIVAIIMQSLELFSAMLGIAFLGIILPNHPFDYVYNFTLSKWLNKPQLPARSKQLKFACTIATLWLVTVVYFMSIGNITIALVLAGALAMVASLPSTIDFCVPSVIYNAIFGIRIGEGEVKIA